MEQIWDLVPTEMVYPRVCGVDEGITQIELGRRGLSPRVQGRCKICEMFRTFVRFIPACAG